jgi:hypothetical protein
MTSLIIIFLFVVVERKYINRKEKHDEKNGTSSGRHDHLITGRRISMRIKTIFHQNSNSYWGDVKSLQIYVFLFVVVIQSQKEKSKQSRRRRAHKQHTLHTHYILYSSAMALNDELSV